MGRNPRGGPGRCTKYRDEARARLASAPPDVAFHDNRRRRWRDRVGRLARLLDELHARYPDEATLGPMLDFAFRAFLPLADAGWWRAHPKAQLNAAARRQLRRFAKRRRQGARSGWARTAVGRLGLRATSAAAIYARHGDVTALDRCARLLDLLDQGLTGAGGGRRRPERAPDSVSGNPTTAAAPPGGPRFDLQRPLEPAATTPRRRTPPRERRTEV